MWLEIDHIKQFILEPGPFLFPRTVELAWKESTNTLVNVRRNSAESFVKSNPWSTSSTRKRHHANNTIANTGSVSNHREVTAMFANVHRDIQVQ